MDQKTVISVIVPCYNAEKTLADCLDSILKQTFDNYEIIVVNDASSDKSRAILQEYTQKDGRVKIVDHTSNKGLFQTRITGVQAATGEYIVFVDADDKISIDWLRKLYCKAQSTDADIVVGEWCFEYESKWIDYLTLDPFRIKDYFLTGNDVSRAFLEQQGKCFSWHVVWNKLYKKTLWADALEDLIGLSQTYGRLNMWEDLAFSSAMWSRAKIVSNIHFAYYFYYKHSDAMTMRKYNTVTAKAYISDTACAINFMHKQFIDNYISPNKIEESRENTSYITRWKERAIANLYKDLCIDAKLKGIEGVIRKQFEFYEEIPQWDDYFYVQKSPLADYFQKFENIKATICSPQIEYISFDIFDTLLLRPFIYPTDLFELMSNKLNESTSSYIDFAFIRQNAEQELRKNIYCHTPSKEDITLDEIYNYIEDNYMIDAQMIQKMKAEELRLEKKLLSPRVSGKELYDLAIEKRKKIILVSDMYLPIPFIQDVLVKNGFASYDKLYISSDILLTKASGHLYDYVIKTLGIKRANRILHIGDNYDSDILMAEKKGIHALQLPKTTERFMNLGAEYGGELYQRSFMNSGWIEDTKSSWLYSPGVRMLAGLAANKFFDNPYRSVNVESDYDGNPGYIGYYAVGSYLLAISSWLIKMADMERIPTIHFVARDGYLIKEAFDRLNQSTTKSNYIRLSRKALLLADVNEVNDLYSVMKKFSVLVTSPKQLIEYLKPIIPEERLSDMEEKLRKQTIFYNRTFYTYEEFEKCYKLLINEYIDFPLLKKYKQELKKYFEKIIKPGDYIFDVGYNGRLESALSNILGYSIGALYLHTNDDTALIRQKKYNCRSFCFYPMKMAVTGAIREHVTMELGPSTIGYAFKNGNLEPIFDEYTPSYETIFFTKCVQDAAIQFINDFIRTYGEYTESIFFNSFSAAIPFESFMANSKKFDRQIFAYIPFEDTLNSENDVYLLNFWDDLIKENQLDLRSEYVTHLDEYKRMIENNNPRRLKKRIHDFLADKLVLNHPAISHEFAIYCRTRKDYSSFESLMLALRLNVKYRLLKNEE